MLSLALLALVCCAALQPGSGSLLIKDKTSLYRAHGNATTFDIEHVFKYPILIGGYNWNPAGNAPDPPDKVPCHTCTNTTAVCQSADFCRDAGNAEMALWFADFNYNRYLNWTILYPNNGIRASHFRFDPDPDHKAEAVVTALGELEYTEYFFEVTGRCIGQPARGEISDSCPTCVACPGGAEGSASCCPHKPVDLALMAPASAE